MDLFNKARLRLDSPASSVGLRDLVKLGVLSSLKYVRALALIRNETFWAKALYRMFLFFGAVGVVSSALMFFYANWDEIAFFNKILLCQSVFVVSVIAAFFLGHYKIWGRVFVIAAVIDVGFMLFLIDKRYPTSADTWVILSQWASLLVLWLVCCRSSLVWIFGLCLINYAAILWGYQFAIPNDIIDWQNLLLCLCIFNILMLIAIESLTSFFIKKQRQYLWITSLVILYSIALFLAYHSIFISIQNIWRLL